MSRRVRVPIAVVLLATATIAAGRNHYGDPSLHAIARSASLPGAVDSVDWKAVDAAMGRPAVVQPGDVHRFNFPRSDLHVTAGGVAIKPAFALGAWLAMKAVPGGVIAMGDLVLTERELSPVIAALQHGGVEQTAIHHHLMGESPRVYYTHVHAHGDPLEIARTVRAALALTAVPPPAPAAPAAAIDLDTVAVAQA